MISGEAPLPRYGLARSFVGERWDNGAGWDICETAHQPAGSEGVLIVRVCRRATARRGRYEPRSAISPESARRDVAITLVLDDSRSGGEIFETADEIANSDGSWKRLEIVVDGDVVDGHEAEYGAKWVAYYLTPLLIVSVVAPVMLHLVPVELTELRPDEVMSSP